MEPNEAAIEQIARIIADGHYNRKAWYGASTKAERTKYLVDNYWPQFIDIAERILKLTITKEPKPDAQPQGPSL